MQMSWAQMKQKSTYRSWLSNKKMHFQRRTIAFHSYMALSYNHNFSVVDKYNDRDAARVEF